jgi:PAS domain S-box-containing protein
MFWKRTVQVSLELAESIINTVREPLIVLDQDLRIVKVSRSFYDFFKVNPEETLGRLIYDLGNKQWDIPVLRELLETILPQQTSFDNYEVEHDFSTIGKRTMLLNARQIQGALGKERIILLAIEDITERKKLEEVMEDSERLFRRLFETASDGIVLLEKREGKISNCNVANEKLLGYSVKECIGRKLEDIGVILDISDFQAMLHQLDLRGILNYRDKTITTRAGQSVNADIYLVNRSSVVQCNIRDTSERKRAEDELIESEKHYRMLFNAIDEGFCIIEVIFDENKKPIDYQFLETNPSFEKQTGLINARGKRMRALAPKHEEYWFDMYGKIALTGQSIHFENRAEQLHRWYDVYAFRFGQPEDRQVAILFNDITGRRESEGQILALNAELEQRVNERTAQLEVVNKELEAFSYSVSHDLRSPLRSIDGFSQILLDEYQAVLDDTAKSYLDRVRKATQHMGRLIEDILALSRAVRSEIHHESVDLSTIAKTVYDNLQQNNPDRTVDVIIRGGVIVNGDPSFLQIALENLLGNAWKFTGRKTQPQVEFGTIVKEGKTTCFVRDNGEGFDMAHAGKLFGAFQRLHTASEFPGTGIGLATVQRIINRHGGQVWAEAEVGKGATFFFTLPE